MESSPAIQVLLTHTHSAEEARHKARLLLREGLHRWGLAHQFVTVRKDAAGRPFLAATPSLPAPPDISFSHAPGAPGLSAVALGRGCRVGVDIEPLATFFPPPMFARIFSSAELAHPLADPVQLWTRKEALLKADGRGVSVDLAQVDVLGDRVLWGGTLWHMHKVDAGAQHACCVVGSAAAALELYIL